jgi:hypothetical protein
MTTFTTEDREEAMRNSCEHCGERLPIDEIHHCANTEPVPFAGFIPLDDEESDNEKLCRLGLGALVCAGRETKMPIKSEFWHILQKHIALRKANK